MRITVSFTPHTHTRAKFSYLFIVLSLNDFGFFFSLVAPLFCIFQTCFGCRTIMNYPKIDDDGDCSKFCNFY